MLNKIKFRCTCPLQAQMNMNPLTLERRKICDLKCRGCAGADGSTSQCFQTVGRVSI